MSGLLQDESEGYEPQRLSRWFASRLDARHVVRKHHANEWAWHEAKAREYNLMVDDMVRPRIDPEIQNTMLKIILERDVG